MYDALANRPYGFSSSFSFDSAARTWGDFSLNQNFQVLHFGLDGASLAWQGGLGLQQMAAVSHSPPPVARQGVRAPGGPKLGQGAACRL